MPTLDDPISVIDPATVSPRPAGMKYGIMWGVAAIVMGLIGYITGISKPSMEPSSGAWVLGLISFIIAIAVVVLAIKQHRAELGGYITTGRCASVGMWTGLFYGLIAAVWSLIFFNLIAPDFFDDLYSTMTAQFEEAGMDDDAIEMAMSWSKMTQNPIFMMISSVVGGLIAGTIVGLIAGLFMKKKAPGTY